MKHPIALCAFSFGARRAQKRSGNAGFAVSGVLLALLIVLCILIVLFLPAVRITDDAMAPSLPNGSIVLTISGRLNQTGDIVIAQVNGQEVVRRVVARGGDPVKIDHTGQILIGDIPKNEPYLKGKTFTEARTYEGTVPPGDVFLLCDDRSQDADSRREAFGSVQPEQIQGRVVWCLWPLNCFGPR